eukprot:2082269-Pleurochrysis_carterae.AAC.1
MGYVWDFQLQFATCCLFMAKSKLATECIGGHRLSFSVPEQPEAAIKPRPRVFIDTLNFKKAGLL